MTRITMLLAVLLLGIFSACTSNPPPPDGEAAPLAYLRALGDAAIRIDGTAALQKYAPEVLPLLDVAPPDGVVTLAEVESILNGVQDPAQVVWLVLMVRGIIESRQ